MGAPAFEARRGARGLRVTTNHDEEGLNGAGSGIQQRHDVHRQKRKLYGELLREREVFVHLFEESERTDVAKGGGEKAQEEWMQNRARTYLLRQANPHRVVRHELQMIEEPEDNGAPDDVHERARHDAVGFQAAHRDYDVQRLVLLLLLLRRRSR